MKKSQKSLYFITGVFPYYGVLQKKGVLSTRFFCRRRRRRIKTPPRVRVIIIIVICHARKRVEVVRTPRGGALWVCRPNIYTYVYSRAVLFRFAEKIYICVKGENRNALFCSTDSCSARIDTVALLWGGPKVLCTDFCLVLPPHLSLF